MELPFAVRLLVREGRSGLQRVGWFLVAIALGVGSLVALYGVQRDAAASARAEARALLGGDLRLQASLPLDERVLQVLDSLASAGASVAHGTSLASVVSAPGSGRARLLQVNAVDEHFPAVGSVAENPVGAWSRLPERGGVLADSQVFGQLGIVLSDSLRVGTLLLEARGVVSGLPVDFGIEWVAGPPLYISLEDLPASGLVDFGSLAQHRAWVALPGADEAAGVRARYREEFRRFGVSIETAQREAEGFASGLGDLTRYLGFVGLLALLLGGLGVGSAVSVYLEERLPSMAVLRCIGARSGTLVRAYLLQTGVLGAIGAGGGVLLGVGLQFAAPALLSGVLPFEISPALHPAAIALGWLLGVWVAILFSLYPLLRIRDVSPLAALRGPVDARRSRARLGEACVALLLAGTLFGVCALQLGDAGEAAVVAASTIVVLCILRLAGAGLGRVSRALLPRRAPFPLRQGIAGLFRPGSQTGTVVVSLGAGTFLMSALLVVETHLRASVDVQFGRDEPTLVLFDIQRDQAEGVRDLLRSEGIDDGLIPIVPARLAEVAGEPVEDILARGSGRRGRWMYTRVYRNTYRDEQGPAERLTGGRWWRGPGEDFPSVGAEVRKGAVRVSLETDLADRLGVGIGDGLVWDVQGVRVASVISSLREVEWSSVQPNFFAVFEPGSLEGAPATFVSLSSTDDAATRQRIQDALLDGFPNVSFLDISVVQATLERLTGQVGLVFRTLAGFVLAGGTTVLFASLLTSRFKRRRESALLKTLGASRRTIGGVLLAEYAALGAIGGAVGLALGGVAGDLILGWQFDIDAGVPWPDLSRLWIGIVLLSVLVGWSVSWPVLRAPPLASLRRGGG